MKIREIKRLRVRTTEEEMIKLGILTGKNENGYVFDPTQLIKYIQMFNIINISNIQTFVESEEIVIDFEAIIK
jgi:hypothetical protein